MSVNTNTNANRLSTFQRLLCLCGRESVIINSTKYEILENLTTGGFSVIDLAENKTNRRKYVLKRVTCHSIDDENVAFKEVEILKKIKHPNIIELVDCQKHGKADIINNVQSQIYIVLPYFRRGSILDDLNIRAAHKDYMHSKEIIDIFQGICEGLKAMHEMNPPIAHRDLKPANVVMGDMGPVILDLGSATTARVQITNQHQARNLQDLAEERCSICYRAPELFNVESYTMIDERTDIFSLGCVLYAMCYFQSPFDDAYLKGNSVALAVLSNNINFPEDAPFDSDMKELIMFMLRTNPMERPFIYSVIEKAGEVLAKLEGRV